MSGSSYESPSEPDNKTTVTLMRKGQFRFQTSPMPWETQFVALYCKHHDDNLWELDRKLIVESLQSGGNTEELKDFLLSREYQPFLPEDWEQLFKQINRLCSNSMEPLMISLVLLAERWFFLHEQIKGLNKQLEKLTSNTAQNLVSQLGIGAHVAATLLVAAGDNPERLKKESSFAALCGVNPIPASSGKTTRYRLNRSGCRSANNALWTITMVRMRRDPRTKDYVARRELLRGYLLKKLFGA